MTLRTKLIAAAALGLATLACSIPAFAAEPPPPPAEASALKTMTDCRRLPTKDARADCYDAAVDGLNKAQAEGKVVVIDQEKLKAVRRQAFGFNLPSLSGLAKGLREDPINAMTFKVVDAHQESEDRWVMETAEGAVWRQTQSSGFALTPHSGSALVVKPGFLGSFFCTVDKQAAFRCKRDR
jgi:hypothetical protein